MGMRRLETRLWLGSLERSCQPDSLETSRDIYARVPKVGEICVLNYCMQNAYAIGLSLGLSRLVPMYNWHHRFTMPVQKTLQLQCTVGYI